MKRLLAIVVLAASVALALPATGASSPRCLRKGNCAPARAVILGVPPVCSDGGFKAIGHINRGPGPRSYRFYVDGVLASRSGPSIDVGCSELAPGDHRLGVKVVQRGAKSLSTERVFTVVRADAPPAS